MTTPASFQVDLQGMIGLLGRHLYSRPQVFIRELLQNAVDAITARSRLTGARSPEWSVRLGGAERRGDPVWCVDDGIGMTLAEVGEVLSTVGRSSKRDRFDLPVSDYLGQFGIGLLSCFMVTDRVVGEYLDLPVYVGDDIISTTPVWALTESELSPESRLLLSELGAELVGGRPLAAIPLSVPGTDLRGTAFVLPYPPSPNAHQSHRVYLGRMLVSDSCDDLLPDWAFFVRCIVTTTAANPTASREQLVDDEALARLRKGLEGWLRLGGLTRRSLPHSRVRTSSPGRVNVGGGPVSLSTPRACSPTRDGKRRRQPSSTPSWSTSRPRSLNDSVTFGAKLMSSPDVAT